MRYTKIIIGVLSIGLLVTSCLQEIDWKQKQFVKILGLEGSSFAERIIELDNGDLMVLGKMGVASHDIESTGSGIEIKELEDQAPFIAITDANGNVKRLKMFPFDAYDSQYFELLDFANRTTFMDILPLNNGGYAVLAEAQGFDFIATIPGVGTFTDNSAPGDVNYAPFLFHLDENLNVVEIRSFNGDPNWDVFTLRSFARMRSITANEIGILLGRKQDLLTQQVVGYSILRLDHNLDTLELAEDFDGIQKFAYDFNLNEQNDLVVLGTENGNINMYHLPADAINGTNELSTFISPDGTLSCCNTNEHFAESFPDGNFLFVFTQPASGVRGAIWNRSSGNIRHFEIGEVKDFSGIIRAPRAVHVTRNEEILIYVLNLKQDSSPVEGYLYKYNKEGKLIFEVKIEGTPGDVIETNDGGIVVVSNDQYNGLFQRIKLIKLDADGKLY